MSDELITYVIGQLRGACWEEEAAAVEALVKERDEALAKRVKAVEALRIAKEWMPLVGGYYQDAQEYEPACETIRNTLAELEGKDHG